MTTGNKGKIFILFVPLFTLLLRCKIVCSLQWRPNSAHDHFEFESHEYDYRVFELSCGCKFSPVPFTAFWAERRSTLSKRPTTRGENNSKGFKDFPVASSEGDYERENRQKWTCGKSREVRSSLEIFCWLNVLCLVNEKFSVDRLLTEPCSIENSRKNKWNGNPKCEIYRRKFQNTHKVVFFSPDSLM